MTGNATAFVALSWKERWLFAQALLLLPVVALAVRCVPFRHLRAIVDRPSPNLKSDRARGDRIAHMVAAAAAYGPYRAMCVPQSLVLQWLLRRHGIRGELRYGVKKVDAEINAHCWVELDGQPLIDSPDVHRHYAVLEPSSAPRWRR